MRALIMAAVAVLGASALVAVASATWESGDDSGGAARLCHFGREHLVREADGVVVDGVAVDVDRARGPARALVGAWSEHSGLYAQALTGDGRAIGAPARLGPRCSGGIALDVRDRSAYVACVERGNEARAASGAVVIHRVAIDRESGAVVAPSDTIDVGPAGRDSAGVDVLAARGRVVVAWHDGAIGAHRVLRAELDDDGRTMRLRAPARVVSSRSIAAGPPALLAHGGEVLTAWEEVELDAHDRLAGRVMIARDGGDPRAVAAVTSPDARPVLAELAGDLVLALVDVRGGRRAALYVSRLVSRRGRGSMYAESEPRRLGRAGARTSAVECGGALALSSPRKYGRRERVVSLYRVDRSLARIGGEQQIYEVGVEPTHAALTCPGEGATTLALFAERATPRHPNARLRTLSFGCGHAGKRTFDSVARPR